VKEVETMKVPNSHQILVPQNELNALSKAVFYRPTARDTSLFAKCLIEELSNFEYYLQIFDETSIKSIRRKAISALKAADHVLRNLKADESAFYGLLTRIAATEVIITPGEMVWRTLTRPPSDKYPRENELQRKALDQLELIRRELALPIRCLKLMESIKGKPGKRVTKEEKAKRLMRKQLASLFDIFLSPERKTMYEEDAGTRHFLTVARNAFVKRAMRLRFPA
jgi:hypothetical protein